MSEITSRSGIRRSAKRRKPLFYRRKWFWAAIVIGVVMIVGAWVGIRGWKAKAELEAAIPLASTIRTQVLAGDSTAVTASVKSEYLTP